MIMKLLPYLELIGFYLALAVVFLGGVLWTAKGEPLSREDEE